MKPRLLEVCRWIRRRMARLLIQTGLPHEIRAAMREADGRYCRTQCVAAAGSFFLPDARIWNGSNDPQRILIGEKTHIAGQLVTYPAGSIRIGRLCYLGEDSRVWAQTSVTIGDHVLISHNVNIMDTDSHELDPVERARSARGTLLDGPPADAGNIRSASVAIGDHVWIGFNAIILKGVTIGEGSIIGAGTIVTKDVPPFSLVVGQTGRIVKQLPRPTAEPASVPSTS